MNIQAKVALDKQKHPERFCPTPRCLWRTDGSHCPRHAKREVTVERMREAHYDGMANT